MFETIYTITDWYDHPRRGVANYGGQPHLYVSEWTDKKEDDAEDTYLLSPIEPEALPLVLEQWAIWCRWREAFHQGKATIETHPALPGDRPRYEELTRLLADKMVIDEANAARKSADFQKRDMTHDEEPIAPHLVVRWYDPDETAL